MVLQQPSGSIPIPPLESGDRLTRAEFERRYEATPEKFKAELIEGVVYVASHTEQQLTKLVVLNLLPYPTILKMDKNLNCELDFFHFFD
jgi:hypothetical protein